MIRNQTVFVIGAGTSVEAGFPCGNELKKLITEKLHIGVNRTDRSVTFKDMKITAAMSDFMGPESSNTTECENYYRTSRQIESGLLSEPSINAFVDNQGQNEHIELCAILAITQSILEAENNSLFKYSDYLWDETLLESYLEKT